MASRNRYVREAIKWAKRWGFPAAVLLAQINQESGFNPNARSGAGAEGIAQFLASTFAGLVARYNLKGKWSPWNPNQAIYVMARYMGSLYKQYGNLYDPLSIYNSGSPWSRGQGIGQTNAYVHNILSSAKHYGSGFDPGYQAPSGPPVGTGNAQQPSANQQIAQQSVAQGSAESAAYTSGYSSDVNATLPGIFAPGQVPVEANTGPRQMSDVWRLIAAQPLASQETQLIAQRLGG